MSEWVELWTKTGQRSLLITSYKRLDKRLWEGHNSCGGGSPCPSTFSAARVPASQAAALPSCSTLTGAELPQAKKVLCLCTQVTSVVSNSATLCGLWPVRLLCQGTGFSRQEYWSVLANTGCHSLLEHYISCCPSRQLPWVPARCWYCQVLPEPLWLKQLHNLHTWPSQGQTKVLQGSLRNKPQWTTHIQR